MDRGAQLGIDEIVAVLAEGDRRPLSPGQPVTQLQHALQTAALLERDHPDDGELAVAGLVHDLGQLLLGARDESHAEDGAAAVRSVLGERVAAIVALHVEAKRYLVGTEDNYRKALAGDSVRSLGRQGGALTTTEASTFLARQWANDAITLRRADDRAKVEGLEVRGLDQWMPVLRHMSAGSSARRPPRDDRSH